ncbi:arsenate reductase ArsC [Pseudomonas sp. NPDC089734]|uniref:arsenate reductase ArsC n=1 Tax=Pseudomonas sp. NPDC089734 TaxID=3364469 RepID=UPI003807527A
MNRKLRVLFICPTNAARSQMAEALLRHADPEHFEAFSAGITPTEIDIRALAALREIDIHDPDLRSKSVDEFAGVPFDYVINLCENSAHEWKSTRDMAEQLTWHFEDPVTSEKPNAFRSVRIEISERVKMFILVKSKKA